LREGGGDSDSLHENVCALEYSTRKTFRAAVEESVLKREREREGVESTVELHRRRKIFESNIRPQKSE
jgi:hypothetical protein